MKPIIFDVNIDELSNPGDTVYLTDTVDMDSYEVGPHEFKLPNKITYDLALTNVGEGILLTGIMNADVIGVCDRCLDDAEFSIACEVNEYFLYEAPEEEQDEESDDFVEFSLIGDDDKIDLSEPLNAALIMETPFVVLCREDCAGLCPDCGANLNHEQCDCKKKREEERLKESPFACLKGLDLDD